MKTKYIKELRDREPRLPIELSDRYIDTQMGVAGFAQDSTITLGELEWRIPGQTPVRIQDQMVALIIAANGWQRPVYFAITVPIENQAWFNPYLQLEGFAFRVLPEPRPVEIETTLHNLKEVFQYRGITDARIYKDIDTATLLHNYRVVFQETADAMLREGDAGGALDLLAWGNERIDLTAPDYLGYWALVTLAAGDTTRAIDMFEEAVAGRFELPGNRIRTYSSLLHVLTESGQENEAARILEQWLRDINGDPDLPEGRPLEEARLSQLLDLSRLPSLNRVRQTEMVQSLIMVMYHFASKGAWNRAVGVVDLWLDKQRFTVDGDIALRATARAAEPLMIVIDVAKPRPSDIAVHVESKSLRGEIVRIIGGVDGEIRRFVAAYVAEEIDSPASQQAKIIDVAEELASAWDSD